MTLPGSWTKTPDLRFEPLWSEAEHALLVTEAPHNIKSLQVNDVVQGVVFFTWIEMLIFGTNANINLLVLMIQKSFGAIFSVGVKVHSGVI